MGTRGGGGGGGGEAGVKRAYEAENIMSATSRGDKFKKIWPSERLDAESWREAFGLMMDDAPAGAVRRTVLAVHIPSFLVPDSASSICELAFSKESQAAIDIPVKVSAIMECANLIDSQYKPRMWLVRIRERSQHSALVLFVTADNLLDREAMNGFYAELAGRLQETFSDIFGDKDAATTELLAEGMAEVKRLQEERMAREQAAAADRAEAEQAARGGNAPQYVRQRQEVIDQSLRQGAGLEKLLAGLVAAVAQHREKVRKLSAGSSKNRTSRRDVAANLAMVDRATYERFALSIHDSHMNMTPGLASRDGRRAAGDKSHFMTASKLVASLNPTNLLVKLRPRPRPEHAGDRHVDGIDIDNVITPDPSNSAEVDALPSTEAAALFSFFASAKAATDRGNLKPQFDQHYVFYPPMQYAKDVYQIDFARMELKDTNHAWFPWVVTSMDRYTPNGKKLGETTRNLAQWLVRDLLENAEAYTDDVLERLEYCCQAWGTMPETGPPAEVLAAHILGPILPEMRKVVACRICSHLQQYKVGKKLSARAYSREIWRRGLLANALNEFKDIVWLENSKRVPPAVHNIIKHQNKSSSYDDDGRPRSLYETPLFSRPPADENVSSLHQFAKDFMGIMESCFATRHFHSECFSALLRCLNTYSRSIRIAHNILSGDASVGKSFVIEVLRKLLIEGSFVELAEVTPKAFLSPGDKVNIEFDQCIKIFNEVGPRQFGGQEGANAAGSKGQRQGQSLGDGQGVTDMNTAAGNIIKNALDSDKLTQVTRESDDLGRKIQMVLTSLVTGTMFMCSNFQEYARTITSRIPVTIIRKSKRCLDGKEASLPSLEEASRRLETVRKALQTPFQQDQAMECHINYLINAGILPDVSMNAFYILERKIKELVYKDVENGVAPPLEDLTEQRHWNRMKNMARTVAVLDASHKLTRGPFSHVNVRIPQGVLDAISGFKDAKCARPITTASGESTQGTPRLGGVLAEPVLGLRSYLYVTKECVTTSMGTLEEQFECHALRVMMHYLILQLAEGDESITRLEPPAVPAQGQQASAQPRGAFLRAGSAENPAQSRLRGGPVGDAEGAQAYAEANKALELLDKLGRNKNANNQFSVVLSADHSRPEYLTKVPRCRKVWIEFRWVRDEAAEEDARADENAGRDNGINGTRQARASMMNMYDDQGDGDEMSDEQGVRSGGRSRRCRFMDHPRRYANVLNTFFDTVESNDDYKAHEILRDSTLFMLRRVLNSFKKSKPHVIVPALQGERYGSIFFSPGAFRWAMNTLDETYMQSVMQRALSTVYTNGGKEQLLYARGKYSEPWVPMVVKPGDLKAGDNDRYVDVPADSLTSGTGVDIRNVLASSHRQGEDRATLQQTVREIADVPASKVVDMDLDAYARLEHVKACEAHEEAFLASVGFPSVETFLKLQAHGRERIAREGQQQQQQQQQRQRAA